MVSPTGQSWVARSRLGVHARCWLSVVAVVGACGGEPAAPSVDPPPPPPPPVTPVATTVTAETGDNQLAAAGAAVALAPSVRVRDQRSEPMAGVTVTFSIDSGGGTVGNATAVTGADGIASSGRWSLGFGRNRLRATVGSLAPIVFTAVAQGELTVADTTVSSNGGVVRIARPGTPVDGLELTFARGAVASSLTMRVSFGDSTGVPRKAGVRLVSPVISIRSSSPIIDSVGPVQLSLPIALSPGEVPVVMLFNRSTGTMMPLPTAASSAGRVYTATRLMDERLLDASSPSASRAQSSPTAADDLPFVIQAVIGTVNSADLAKDLDTGYQPAVDDWEFDRMLTWVANENLDVSISALGATAAWYFDKEKARRGSLNTRYQQAKGAEHSNPRGFHLMAAVRRELANGSSAIGKYADALSSIAEICKISQDSLTLLAIKSSLFLTNRPYVLGSNEASGRAFADLLIYAARGNTLSVSIGTSAPGPNAPRTIALVGGRFTPTTWAIKAPDDGTFTSYTQRLYLPSGLTSGVPAATLASLWQAFFDRTIGAVSGVLAPNRIVTREMTNVGDTLFLPDDTTRIWVECSPGPGCPYSFTATGNFVPTGNVGGGTIYDLPHGSDTWVFRNSIIKGEGARIDSSSDGQVAGLGIVAAGEPGGPTAMYMDWKQFVIRKKRLVISPAPLRVPSAYDFTMTASYDRPTPANARWEWQLGDGRTLTTSTNTLTTQYPVTTTTKTYSIKVSMKTGSTLEATGRIVATVEPPLIGWSLRTATVQSSTLPAGGIGVLRSDTLVFNFATGVIGRLTGSPSTTALFVAGVANPGPACDAGALFQQAPNTAAVADTLVGNQIVGLLAACGDPDFTGSLAVGPLGRGTVVGSAANTPSPTTLSLPGGAINATMNARNLTGTFVWNVRYSGGIGTYTVSFTAVQIRPR
jgi:hypothetical protein